jgi:3-dehydroquinate synthase
MAFLTSLPDRELRNGMAEILKIALMLDADLVRTLQDCGPQLIEQHFQSSAGAAVIRRAVLLMIDQLEPNLWEFELDRRVDFGHSFSPLLELADGSGLLHGEAVAIDMVLSCAIALGRGMLDVPTWRQIVGIVDALALPHSHRLCDPAFLWRALQETVLHRNGQQRLPIPVGLGQSTFCNDVTFAEIERACQIVAELHVDHVGA